MFVWREPQRPLINYTARLLQFNASVGGWFGVISYDWSNAKAQWAQMKPMDDEERLVTQTSMTKAVSPNSHVFVYRNLVKALPWYTSVREKISDPAYAGWFLAFKPGGSFPNGTWHVPACDNNFDPPLCSDLYHDQEQCVWCCAPIGYFETIVELDTLRCMQDPGIPSWRWKLCFPGL